MRTARGPMIFFLPALLVICLKGSPGGSKSAGSPSYFCDLAKKSTQLVPSAHTTEHLSKRASSRDTIQCPWHFSRFGLADGSVCEGPLARLCLLTKSALSRVKWRLSFGHKSVA